ncbi:MAG: hypothetical protein LUQ09_00610 [Methanomassiliicoccales archaeon]|nr:hypothetical protein [Methanomassiliicoccales archaeon]
MKWASHIAIGKVIADALELSPGERKAFLDGIVEPDRHKERGNRDGRSYRLSHHDPSDRVIMLHVWMARRSMLRNDTYQGYRHLGMALHYIQDKSTSKGFLGLTHERREEKLAKVEPSRDEVMKGLKEHASSSEFVRRSLSEIKPLKDPKRIMAQASYRSASVAAAVIDMDGQTHVKKDYARARRKHALATVPLIIGSLAIGASISILWSSPYPMVPAAVLALIAVLLDRPYRQLRRLAEWNGLGKH